MSYVVCRMSCVVCRVSCVVCCIVLQSTARTLCDYIPTLLHVLQGYVHIYKCRMILCMLLRGVAWCCVVFIECLLYGTVKSVMVDQCACWVQVGLVC